MGYRDDDLYIRWLQFGVFSPIMRLHSTAIELLGKEPWKYRSDVYSYAKEWLNFRHRLIPYIFAMDYRNHKDGIALCEPMYYSYPDNYNAYNVKNQYMFGSELMICPITKKQNKKTNFGEVTAWLPEGRWTDIFTGQSYNGDKTIILHRDLNSIPVLAKEGAVIPLAKSNGNDTSNPKELEVWIYAGNNRFTLYEDNGRTDYENHNAKTVFNVSFDEANKQLRFTVDSPVGDISVIPQNRKLRLVFKDLCVDNLSCSDYEIINDNGNAVIEIADFTANSNVEIKLDNAEIKRIESIKEQLIYILSRWQEKTIKKAIAYRPFEKAEDRDEIRYALNKAKLPRGVSSAIKELLETI